MNDQAKGNLIRSIFVALIAAIGIYIVLAGLGTFGRSARDAPGWVLVVAGTAFLFAAASMAIDVIGSFLLGASARKDGTLTDAAPAPFRLAQMLFSLAIVALLATVATWVAFDADDAGTVRKFAFGIGAALCWAIFAGAAIWKLRRLRK